MGRLGYRHDLRYNQSGGPSSLIQGLITYWRLEELSGTRFDAFGTNHLTDNNTVQQAVGIINNAALFDPANSEYLSLAHNATIAFTTGFSCSFWVYFNSNATLQNIINKSTFPNPRGWNIEITPSMGTVQVYVTDDPNVGGSGPFGLASNILGSVFLSLATWYNFVIVYDGTGVSDDDKLKVYANSVNQAPLSFLVPGIPAALSPLSTGDFNIGQWPALGRFADARVDEVSLWNRPLTQAEIDKLYNGGVGNPYPFT
jgi:hypothetical protein